MKTILLNPDKLKVQGITEIKVVEDTQYVVIDSGKTIKADYNLQLVFEKPGILAEVLGIFDLGAGQEIKIIMSTKHVASNTSCTVFIKAVLNDRSSFDFRGKIMIGKEAVQTNAFLHDNVLVAGENTKRNSQPTLEIETNDVKASHDSTTGRVDENQLYYLESRGLSEPEAKNLITAGFLAVLVDKILDKEIREIVLNKIKSKRACL